LLIAIAIAGCKKVWQEPTSGGDPNLTINLYQAISKNANTSVFAGLLVKSGYDKILSASKGYTVWAPTDAALASLSTAVTNDSVKLRKFVANHIANGSYIAGSSTAVRVPVLNGKYVNTIALQFDSATISTANSYASNGLYHVIDKYIPARDNCWEWVRNSTTTANSTAFFISQDYNFFDSTRAVQIGVNPITGQPVYQSGTGIVVKNRYLENAVNVNDETNEYTFLVLNDASYTTEFNKLSPWFKTTTVDSTNSLTGFWSTKDLAVKGAYTATQLPDTLISQFGVKVPVDKSKIVASYKTSNGWVHVMSQVNFNLIYKFPPIIIQGENPDAFAADRSSLTFYRVRTYPASVTPPPSGTQGSFKDILLQNYSYASYWIRYRAIGLNSMKYNAYWVAVNDVQTTPLWTQKLCVDSSNNPTTFPYVTVAYQNYSEVSLGQFTINNYRDVRLFVVGANTSSNAGGSVSINVDYIKLVPAF
jgi:uncharacterized surface protein with fasciclin (FAS1) repeats